MIDKKVTMQIVNHEDGTRTVPVATTMQEMCQRFTDMDLYPEDHAYGDDLVLILAVEEAGKLYFDDFPLMKVVSFIYFVNSKMEISA